MATTWEELELKYKSAPSGATPAADSDPWAALERKYAAVQPDTTPGQTAPDQPVQKKEATMLDRVMAVPAGVNRAAYAFLPGLPVDTALNAADLVKAGVGYTTSKITGRAPPGWTEPFDRKNIAGSSDWIASKVNRGADALGVRSPIDNPAPEDQAARILYSGGLLAGSSIVPNPRASIGAIDQVRNIGMGTTGGLLNGGVAEFAPEWAGVAGMAPQMGIAAGSAGFKRAIRGGEEGRRNMEQRMQDFRNAGVDWPSAGLASGNGLVQGVENLLSLTPGSVGVFERSKQRMIDGMQAKTNQIRDSISRVHGPAEAGSAIQSDLKGQFKDRVSTTYERLNDKVARAVGPNTPISVDESIATAERLSTPIPGAVATSSNFINPRIAKIHADLGADSGIVPNSAFVLPNGRPTGPMVASSVQGVPFSAIKSMRTRIGQEAASKNIMATPQEGEWKQLYGAMTDDMRVAATKSDTMTNPVTMPATTAFNRSNEYYTNAMNRIGKMNTLVTRSTPESAFNSVATSLQSGPTSYARVRNAVTPETRGTIVATIIDDMGKAMPGQQGASGDAWSPRTFLTNYNKLDGAGKTELFKRLPGGKAHGENLADIAKAADMISQGSKVWANPSGTTAALTARGAFGAIGVGAFFQPVIAAGTAGGLITGNAVSRLLVSPIFTNWLAKTPKAMTPEKMQSYAQRLAINAQMSKDAQFQQDVSDYMQSVRQAINDSPDTDSQQRYSTQ